MAETVGDLQLAKLFLDLANSTLDAAAKLHNKETSQAVLEFGVYLIARSMDQTEYKIPAAKN